MTALRLHEVVFGLFVLTTALRLWASGQAAAVAALFTLAFVLNAAVIARGPERLRLAFYPVTMVILFGLMRWAAPAIAPVDGTPLIEAWDGAAFDAMRAVFAPIESRAATELMAAFYIYFQVMIFVVQIAAIAHDPGEARRLFRGLYCVYALGFLGYTLLPAPGPYLSMAPTYAAPLEGYVLMPALAWIYPYATNFADAFPSLHVAVSVYLLLYDRRFHPRRFRWTLVPTIGICVSTLYLRYHYGTDVVAGLLLALAIHVLATPRRSPAMAVA